MLAQIAAFTEPLRPQARLQELRALCQERKPSTAAEAIASVVEMALETVPCAALFVPTRSGTTARMISRFKPAVWIIALTHDPVVRRALAFSYGVEPLDLNEEPEHWRDFAAEWLRKHETPGSVAMLVAGPSDRHPENNHRLEFMRVAPDG
jgi:pyruvate kinase